MVARKATKRAPARKAKKTSTKKLTTKKKPSKKASKKSTKKSTKKGAAKAPPISVVVVNMIPRTLSGEEHQDSEPTIAVNPANPNQIAASAVTPGRSTQSYPAQSQTVRQPLISRWRSALPVTCFTPGLSGFQSLQIEPG